MEQFSELINPQGSQGNISRNPVTRPPSQPIVESKVETRSVKSVFSQAQVEKVRELMAIANKKPRPLQNYTTQLTMDQREEVSTVLKSAYILFQKMDNQQQFPLIFFMFNKVEGHTIRFFQLKTMFRHQWEALRNGVFLADPEVAKRTRAELSQYYNFVTEKIQQRRQNHKALQFQAQAQPSASGQMRLPGPQNQNAVQSESRQMSQDAPLQQSHAGYGLPQNQSNQPHIQTDLVQTMSPIPSLPQPIGPSASPSQLRNEQLNIQRPPTRIRSQGSQETGPQEVSSAPNMRGIKIETSVSTSNNGIPQHEISTGLNNTSRINPQLSINATSNPQHNVVSQQKLSPFSKKTNIGPSIDKKKGKRISAVSPLGANKSGSQSLSDASPFVKTEIPADQLKLPTTRKRKANTDSRPVSTATSGTSASMGSPEELRSTPITNTSPSRKKAKPQQSPLKHETQDAINNSNYLAITNEIQIKQELAQMNPLSYFISSLGEALNVPKEMVATTNSSPVLKQDGAKLVSQARNRPLGGLSHFTSPANLNCSPKALFSPGRTPLKAESTGSNRSDGQVSPDEPQTPIMVPGWSSAAVSAVEIKNAFQGVEAVKTSYTGIRAAFPGNISPSYVLSSDTRTGRTDSAYSNNDSGENRQASLSHIPVMLKGLENRPDVNIWNYDEVVSVLCTDEEALKKDYWTLDC